MYNMLVDIMTSNPLWGAAIGLFFLALPMLLIPLAKLPPIAAFTKAFPMMSTITTLMMGVGTVIYYWTVGLASFLLILLSVLVYFKDVSLIF